MVLTLERDGWISRQPGTPRSIRLLVERAGISELSPAAEQLVGNSAQGH